MIEKLYLRNLKTKRKAPNSWKKRSDLQLPEAEQGGQEGDKWYLSGRSSFGQLDGGMEKREELKMISVFDMVIGE